MLGAPGAELTVLCKIRGGATHLAAEKVALEAQLFGLMLPVSQLSFCLPQSAAEYQLECFTRQSNDTSSATESFRDAVPEKEERGHIGYFTDY